MSSNVKVAAVQMDVQFASRPQNLSNILSRLQEAAQQGAKLIVFPECTMTGYCYRSREEAEAQSEPLDGETTRTIAQQCRALDVFCVYGLLESDGARLFNALALLGPQGLIGGYRKVHLPGLGVDRFVDPGDRPFEVHDLGLLRVGLQICYDGSFPEPTRVMALNGADLVLLPTNWPPGAGLTADYVPNCRALENHVYFLAANRIGHERGFDFVGKSRICEPNGGNLAFADHREEAILYAEIDPAVARNKHLVRVPNQHEIDRFGDRRPEKYGMIVEPVSTPIS